MTRGISRVILKLSHRVSWHCLLGNLSALAVPPSGGPRMGVGFRIRSQQQMPGKMRGTVLAFHQEKETDCGYAKDHVSSW
ncbi:hypothetical protein Krac_12057 [Ktedonobacter racemifer DSM 44963]|uniref:Uncharacterized protein n=1 Tax=Ktedonobacter racemifer DSM 44963 TaxID=485913 RepID=D6TF36_KTERA|nr:hypothetical protein Krac_12057 [Ktedonobacter racemifer DSM 44963]